MTSRPAAAVSDSSNSAGRRCSSPRFVLFIVVATPLFTAVNGNNSLATRPPLSPLNPHSLHLLPRGPLIIHKYTFMQISWVD